MPAGKTAMFTGSTSGRRPPNAAQGINLQELRDLLVSVDAGRDDTVYPAATA
jgi:hypothetical protein